MLRKSTIAALALILSVIAAAPTSQIAIASDLSVGIKAGFSSLQIEAGESYNAELGKGNAGLGLEIRPQINFEFPKFNAAADVFYQGRMGSAIGSFPASRLGAGLLYFPLGMALNNSLLDNGIHVRSNRMAPYLSGQALMTTIAVTDSGTAFNGLTIGYQIGGGVEVPVGQSWAVTLDALLEGTMLGGVSAGAEGENATLSLRAFSFLLGFAIHP